MAHAKLSQSAAASLAFVRSLHNDTTHSIVKKEVFAHAKASYGIPDKHRIKVELDPALPNYLDIVRKSDGALYELGADGRWSGAPANPETAPRWVYARLDVADLVDCAFEALEAGHTQPVESAAFVTRDEPFIVRDGAVYVRIDATRLGF